MWRGTKEKNKAGKGNVEWGGQVHIFYGRMTEKGLTKMRLA